MDGDLVDLEATAKRLDWELDEFELDVLQEAITDLSEEARHHGLSSWVSEFVAPAMVVRTVGKAAARFMKNHHGYTQSRAGDETLGFVDQGSEAGSPTFTSTEVQMFRAFRGLTGGLGSVQFQAWGTSPGLERDAHRVPTDIPGEKGFPYPMESDRL